MAPKTDEDKEILRKAAVVLEHVRSDQVTDASLHSAKAFQTQFTTYVNCSDCPQDVYCNRGIEDNFGLPAHVELGSWFNNNVPQTAGLEGHGNPCHDLQDSGFPVYDNGQPATHLAGSSHRDEEFPLDLSSCRSRSSGSVEQRPALSPTRSIDTVVDVGTAFNPLQLFPEMEAPMIQLPPFETRSRQPSNQKSSRVISPVNMQPGLLMQLTTPNISCLLRMMPSLQINTCHRRQLRHKTEEITMTFSMYRTG